MSPISLIIIKLISVNMQILKSAFDNLLISIVKNQLKVNEITQQNLKMLG